MIDLQERLATALSERYDVQRELGRGGMATVFLASERSSGRLVALKVFRSDVAMALGAERFLREIDLAARLDHPNIVPLLDSGQAASDDGHPPLLYYVMPFIEGESLADRLERSGELQLEDAVAIVQAVAAALHHAHQRGIVHRDVKPPNIMLSPDGPMVTDFGIAHAIGQTGEQKLTSTGCVVGTPAYMSPEQAAGTYRLDGRSDIYGLGCVTYEMLLGEPPFSGPSTQAVLARHAVGQVPSMRVVRPTIPPAVEAVVHRCLAKSPADRYQTAGEYADALATAAREPRGTAALPAQPARRRPWLVPAVAAFTAVVMVTAVLATRPWTLLGGGSQSALDDGILAVLPFTLAGGSDTSGAVLAAGLTDLVVQRLPGDGGPRGVRADAEGRRDSDRLAGARAAGAARMLHGELWSSGGEVVLSGTLSDVETGAVVARVDRSAGPRDSLLPLLDRMLVTLLLRGTAAPPSHVEALETLPLAAARAWLGATDDFHGGRFTEAAENYATVLRADSTAYPAALGLAILGDVHNDDVKYRGLQLARAELARLTRADSMLLEALSWDQPGRSGSSAERLLGFEEATRVAPELADRWYLLGERLFHDGPLLGHADVLERSAQSFRHAVEREPGFVPAIGHLIDIAAGRGDTAEVRQLAPRYLAASDSGELADYYRWRVAAALADSASLAAVRTRFDAMGPAALERVVHVVQLDGLDAGDAVRATAALWARSGARTETRWAFTKQRELALNRGRPREADSILTRQRASVGFRARDGLAEVVNALFWGADTAAPAAWAAAVARRVDAPDARRPLLDEDIHYERCGVGLWRALRGDPAGAAHAHARLSAGLGADSAAPGRFEPLCVDIISAVLAAERGAPDAAVALSRLDSAAAAAPATITWILVAANLTAARLWEQRGNVERALAAVRRRPYIVDIGESRVLVALSTMLAEEGRLAALAGDTAGAKAAYGRYLALREGAEQEQMTEIERIRAQLGRL